MARSRMMGGDEPEQTPSPRTTIVGGRPPEQGAALPPVPTGIQRLLRLASVDVDFRRQLVARRAEVAAAAEIPLTASEQAILEALPDAHLERMAAQMPAPPKGRRDFLRQTAATAVVLLGGAALSEAVVGCDKSGSKPVTTEPAPGRPEENVTSAVAGVAPDEPPPHEEDGGTRPEHREMETEGGAAPDEPPEPDAPDEPAPTAEPPPPPRPKSTIKTRGVSHDLPPDKGL